MLELTCGGRTIGGLDAIAFFEALPDCINDEAKTESFCMEYEWALNRLRYEVSKSVVIPPKRLGGKRLTYYTCGKCGHVLLSVNADYCHNCGRAIDWHNVVQTDEG